jgi:hypothetical protein
VSARQAVVQDLTCPQCGKGPYGDLRALESHRVVHKTTTCGACGKKGINPKGLGGHRRICEAYQRQQNGGGCRSELAHIERLLGRLTNRNGLRRIRELLARTEVFPAAGYLVVGDTYGPYLTRRERVGDVVAGSRDACIVLDLARVIEALGLEELRERAERSGWDRLP